MKKITVALICHFSNNYIQSKLKLRRKVNEYAPWITSTIEGLRNNDKIELHVIAPHDYLVSDTSFSENNIHYHFFSIGIPVIHRHWPHFFRYDLWTKYKSNRRKISKIIEKINPDIVHLYGAENAYYSSSILDLLNYKHLVTIQGFVYKEVNAKEPPNQRYRVKIEREILSKAKNFGIECSYMKDEIGHLNTNANLYWHRIPINIPVLKNSFKKYDIVYFGRVTKKKGLEDFIKVVGNITRKYAEISVKIIGYIGDKYYTHLKKLAVENNCVNNIEFVGFIPAQTELHDIVSKAKIYLFPTYNDTIPGTVIEAMFLNVAVISYSTGGIPVLNEKEKTIELIPQGNIKELTQKTVFLLENDAEREEIQKKAFNYVQERYCNNKPIAEIVEVYNSLTFKNVLK